MSYNTSDRSKSSWNLWRLDRASAATTDVADIVPVRRLDVDDDDDASISISRHISPIRSLVIKRASGSAGLIASIVSILPKSVALDPHRRVGWELSLTRHTHC